MSERAEAGPWHVREPEGEEHGVIGGVRSPIEEIRSHIGDVGASHPFPVECEHLGCAVHDGETVGCPCQTIGPPPCSPRQFQDRAVRTKGSEGVVHDRYLALPFEQRFLAPVEATPSLPPFVVFGRPCPVVRTLLGEQVIVVHAHSFAPVGESLNDRTGALGAAVPH
jgi:hypothetical protein